MTNVKTGKKLESTSPKRWAISDIVRLLVPVLIMLAGVEMAPAELERVVAAVVLIVGVLVNIFAGNRERVNLLATDAITGRPDSRVVR